MSHPLLLYLHNVNLHLLHPNSPFLLNPEPPLQLPQVKEKKLKTTMDGIRVIRRTPQQGESSQARAKIALCTSGTGELNYLPADVLEEHRLAHEALELKEIQDREDLKIA